MPYRRVALMPLVALAAFPAAAFAQDARLEASDTGDTAWMLAVTALVLLAALPGVALFQAGRARTTAFIATLVQAGAVAAAVSLTWIVVGYTLAFGTVTSGWLGGGNAWMLIQLGNVREGLTVPESAFAMLQITCAMLAALIMPGAWAGRARFGWVVLFSTGWSLVVLAPIMHWIWGGGWLARASGTIDYAGGLTLELTAGTSALVAALLMGRGQDFGKTRVETNIPAVALTGGFLMWVGWLALCGGSAFSANDDGASALMNAHAAACAGVLVRIAYDRLRRRSITAETIACGLVSGLAGIAPAALYVSAAGAAVIGALAAVLTPLAATLVRRIGIDDRFDVFALFAVPALVGGLLLAPLMSESLGGTGYDAGMNPVAQLVAQMVGVLVVLAWSTIGSAILALMTSLAFPMRVSEGAEAAGLDASFHTDR